jgi:hypothetical protein
MRCVVDTNIINMLIDGTLSTDDFPADAELIATHVQIDEINRTPDQERRARLFLSFTMTVRPPIPTESFILDDSRLDHGKLSEDRLYNALKAELDALNNSKPNNVQDASIAEVAIINGYTLLTAGCDLATVAQNHGGTVRYFPP